MIDIVAADLNQQSHADAMIELLDGYAKDPMGGGEHLSNHTRDNLISELQRRSDLLAIVAFDDGVAAGLMICFEGFSTFRCAPLLNIHDVIVAKPFRQQGISRAMFTFVEEIARQRNYCKLTLEVLEGNRVAQDAYRSFGFSGYELDPEMGKALFWEKSL
ncbi:MAG: GNAT family N-acetyltransferase [Gammaproteobacteria bacterium]|nr:GNAT family N-acetyltransferase [Gammaproteobacteria bacterium]